MMYTYIMMLCVQLHYTYYTRKLHHIIRTEKLVVSEKKIDHLLYAGGKLSYCDVHI